MAQVIYARRALADFDRALEFLAESDPAAAAHAVALIQEAVGLLERHPLVGRPAESGLRELVISRGRFGYVALYEYLEDADVMVVLALRHQSEAGYA